MVLSDMIAGMIEEMLEAGGGVTEVRRNDLASRLGCVPSQINYVITSRFTPQRGYTIESRRGGGGGVTIRCVAPESSIYPMHIVNTVGNTLSQRTAAVFIRNLLDYECISEREARLISGAISDNALGFPSPVRDEIRARLFKSMLTNLFRR